MNNYYYTVYFSVVSHLICSAIIGIDVLLQRETDLLKFGRKTTQLDFSNLAANIESNEFRPMIIDPPKIISDDVRKFKTITTIPRHSIKGDFKFMQIEISDLL